MKKTSQVKNICGLLNGEINDGRQKADVNT